MIGLDVDVVVVVVVVVVADAVVDDVEATLLSLVVLTFGSDVVVSKTSVAVSAIVVGDVTATSYDVVASTPDVVIGATTGGSDMSASVISQRSLAADDNVTSSGTVTVTLSGFVVPERQPTNQINFTLIYRRDSLHHDDLYTYTYTIFIQDVWGDCRFANIITHIK